VKAIAITRPPDVGRLEEELRLLDMPDPRSRGKEILVRVVASCIVIDNIHMAEGSFFGRWPRPRASRDRPVVLGSNFSGIVVGTGPRARRFAVGDAVFGLGDMGQKRAWAELYCVGQAWAWKKPGELSHGEAAAFSLAGPVAFVTVEKAGVGSNHRCVVVGASGGIGSLIIQFLKWKGAHVTAVCSARNAGFVTSLGADRVIDYTNESFADVLEREDASIDRVFDCVGGLEIEAAAVRVLKRSGTFLTVCGPLKYPGESRLGWGAWIRMIAHLVGRSVGSRFRGPKYVIAGHMTRKAIGQALSLMLHAGIRPSVGRVVRMTEPEMREAIAYVRSKRARGRVVVAVSDDDGRFS
jgi:NADPH:quinone reductase-like Zn-dependent oxidoreductase